MMSRADLMFERRHPELDKKRIVWDLVQDSYVGGIGFKQKNYLYKHPREYKAEYEERKRRTTYFNYVQPLADILVGLLYTDPVKRVIDERFEYILEKASGAKDIRQFMQMVATNSLLFTCGVLVDSPSFDTAVIVTEADRKENSVYPYCIFYTYNKIRDFYLSNNRLEWILLDNSHCRSEDPSQPRSEIKEYRLWTPEYYQDFSMDNGTAKEGEMVEHKLGEIPFVFALWKDTGSDYIADSPFEDIALLSQSVFNLMSYMDEILASGTFKALFYPGHDVPADLVEGGLGNLFAVPFDPTQQHKPFFDGRGIEDITPFLTVIDMYRKEMLAKVGLDKDTEKSFAQSGVAKSLEFRKAHAILSNGAMHMENVEREIVRFCGLWEDVRDIKCEIKYPERFDPNELDAQINRLYTMFNSFPYSSVKKYAASEILKLQNMDQEKVNLLVKEIEKEKTEGSILEDLNV